MVTLKYTTKTILPEMNTYRKISSSHRLNSLYLIDLVIQETKEWEIWSVSGNIKPHCSHVNYSGLSGRYTTRVAADFEIFFCLKNQTCSTQQLVIRMK